MSLPTTMKAVVIEGKAPVIKTVPLPNLPKGYLLIKPKAVAGNPTDWKHIEFGMGPQGSLVGCDIAGEIVQLADGVDSKEFHVGDYVYGFIHGASVRTPDNGAFAEYVALDSQLSFHTPADIHFSGKNNIPEGAINTFEGAATIPCSWTTAGVTLFYHFNKKYEWEATKPQEDSPLLVWGAATALGQPMIQLAKKYNCFSKIIAVASKKHEKQLKEYGADEIFDYHDADVIQQIKAKYPNITTLLDCVSSETTLNQTYQCASETSKATVMNYMGLTIDAIKPEFKRENVDVTSTIIYLSLGYDVPLFGSVIPKDDAYRAHVVEFIKQINPHFLKGEFHHIPVKVYQNGLEGAVQIVKDIQAGKTSGEKFVSVFN
ncbi:similar to Saccharomyces cerevisiae YNL134C Putative protein of unknown function with similarity to dehydrogenases from other model organisms [Maudiozyma saulgeensis]|uniref:Enoyl reductase (ER) domain-containing protein n=1 Tax=Maudiozyma saulgeensis TaxID=1789683 RepID=A0A1X7QYU9_9SACH|nr:similar to Saccharomyces cerevisiae YNL134C Putative protein of unknown function with similarity to dehydrogenases from other model organisms [Kazachstania saulgeensis]